MAGRNFRVDFYAVDVHGDKTSFEALLDDIWQRPADQRMVRLRGFDHWLYDLRRSPDGRFLCGEIGRLSVDLIDPKGDQIGNRGPMPINEDEGQVHQNFFVYHVEGHCLAMPFQQSGVRIGLLGEYVNHYHGPATTVHFDPVERQESVLARLAGVRRAVKTEIKLRIPGNTELLRDAGLADSDVVRLAEAYDAVTIKIELSRGRESGSISGVTGLFRKLKDAGSAVQMAKLYFDNKEGERDFLDLLHMMLKDEIEIEITPERLLDNESAYGGLIGVIEGNWDEIQTSSGR